MREIVSHTSIRGLAALGVVLYHLNNKLLLDQDVNFIKNACFFVDLFFILSGFVMAYIYQNFLREDISYVEIKHFFSHRFARIYPLHLLTLAFMIGLSMAAQQGANSSNANDVGFLWNVIQNVFLIQAWGLSDQYVFNFPSWSISAEFAAYLSFPIFALYWRARLPVIVILFGLCFFYIALSNVFNGHLDVGERLNLLRGPPSFLLGMVINHYRSVATLISIKIMTILQVLTVIAIAAIMQFNCNQYLLFPAFASLVLLTWEDRGAISHALCLPWLKSLGNLSFGIYLLHIPVRTVGYSVWPKISRGLPLGWQNFGFNFSVILVTIVVSSIVYRYFECPAREYLKRILL